jgi:hypothetical protein
MATPTITDKDIFASPNTSLIRSEATVCYFDAPEGCPIVAIGRACGLRASSKSGVITALILGLIRSIRAMAASSNLSWVSSRRPTRSACALASIVDSSSRFSPMLFRFARRRSILWCPKLSRRLKIPLRSRLRLSAQLIEQRLGVFQIRGIEPLGELVVNLGEHRARLFAAIGVAQQSGKVSRTLHRRGVVSVRGTLGAKVCATFVAEACTFSIVSSAFRAAHGGYPGHPLARKTVQTKRASARIAKTYLTGRAANADRPYPG